MAAALRLSIAALLLLVPAARGQEPQTYRPKLDAAAIDLRTDWYGVYLQGEGRADKIGYVQSVRTKQPDGTIREAQVTHLKLVSFGQKAEITATQAYVFEGQAPYRLLKGELTQDDGKTKQTTTVARTADGLKLTHDLGGVTREKVLQGQDYDLADALAPEMWIRSQPRVGDAVTYRHLDLYDQKFDLQTSTIKAVKDSLAKGVPTRFYEVETVSRNKGIKALSRHDHRGLMLSDQIAVFELRLEPEKLAKDTRYSQDLFVMGMAKVDRPVGDPKAVTALVLAVPAKDAAGLEDGPRQQVAPGENGARLLKLGKAHGKRVPATAAEVEEALAETANYPLSDPRIKALAAQAVGDVKTPEEKVRRLVRFVHGFVRPSLSANVPNIPDLLKHKKGDCKSYALLLTTLARAAGVPAREVSGLLYVGDDLKAFGGHAWNEVVIDGVWVPVDAAMNEVEVNATHISFGAEHRATKTLLDTLGKLSFKLVEVTPAP